MSVFPDPIPFRRVVAFANADRPHRGVTLPKPAYQATENPPFDFSTVPEVTCFTSGTLILTPSGHVPIDALQVGDTVVTRDRGPQPIRWIGTSTVTPERDAAPVAFAPGTLGNETSLIVSPHHRMLLSGWRCATIAGTQEALATASALVNDRDVTRVTATSVTYVHMAFDRHEIITAGGVQSESFHPAATPLDQLADGTRSELLRLFPDLAAAPPSYGPVVRPEVKPYEARMIRP